MTLITFFFAVLLISVLVVLGVLLVLSPGTPRPFLDGSGKTLTGSISEKIRVRINGVEQGMFIKSKNMSNPMHTASNSWSSLVPVLPSDADQRAYLFVVGLVVIAAIWLLARRDDSLPSRSLPT